MQQAISHFENRNDSSNLTHIEHRINTTLLTTVRAQSLGLKELSPNLKVKENHLETLSVGNINNSENERPSHNLFELRNKSKLKSQQICAPEQPPSAEIKRKEQSTCSK